MTPTTRRSARGTIVALSAFLALTLGATGCGFGGSSQSAGGAGGDNGLSRDVGSAPEQMAPDKPAEGTSSSTVDLANQQMLVRTAAISLTVTDIDKAATALRQVASSHGGVIADESLERGDGRGVAFANVTLRVPADRLDSALDAIAGIGTVHDRSTSSEDVKAQYVDVEARAASLRRSVERLRTLIDKATSVTDIAAIEGELSRREADLEAMEAQLKSLKESVALSTITVSMSTQPEVFEDSSGGFMGGLKAGWRAFLTAIGYALTALGAMLPFLVAAAIVITPFVLWLRHRLRRAGGPGSPAAGMPPAPHGSPTPGTPTPGEPASAPSAGTPPAAPSTGAPASAPGTGTPPAAQASSATGTPPASPTPQETSHASSGSHDAPTPPSAPQAPSPDPRA